MCYTLGKQNATYWTSFYTGGLRYMETVIEEKLYKIVRKKGSHVNTKLNPDGSKAAIQFTDDGNDLNGPVNLIEIDERELVRTEYIPVQDEPRTLKEIVWQDVVVPAMRELLYQAMMEGYDNLCAQIKAKAIPAVKVKAQSLAKDACIIASGVKDGLTGKTPKALELVSENTVAKSGCQLSFAGVEEQQKTIRSKEEIENIVYAMRMSAITLAACIRMLNNTVMADDGTDPQRRLEIQRNLQTLSTRDVMQQIDLLLEDKNRALLNEAELAMLSSFKEGYFLVNERRIPVAKYLTE